MAKTWPTKRQRQTLSDRNDVFARSDAIAARRVLRDVHIGLKELNTAQSDSEWRLRWVSVVILLRAVGHVLDKVDGNRSIHLKQAASEVWKEIKENPKHNEIYYGFIEKERNNILKEYNVGELIIYPIDSETKGRKADYPMLVGERVKSQSALVREAMGWWEGVLLAVETKAETLLRASVRHRKSARRSRTMT